MAADIDHRLMPLLLSAGEIHLDLQDVFRQFWFGCIYKFSFGFDPVCLKPSLSVFEFTTEFDLASKLSVERVIAALPLVWKAKRLLNLGSEKRLKSAIKSFHELAE